MRPLSAVGEGEGASEVATYEKTKMSTDLPKHEAVTRARDVIVADRGTQPSGQRYTPGPGPGSLRGPHALVTEHNDSLAFGLCAQEKREVEGWRDQRGL